MTVAEFSLRPPPELDTRRMHHVEPGVYAAVSGRWPTDKWGVVTDPHAKMSKTFVRVEVVGANSDGMLRCKTAGDVIPSRRPLFAVDVDGRPFGPDTTIPAGSEFLLPHVQCLWTVWQEWVAAVQRRSDEQKQAAVDANLRRALQMRADHHLDPRPDFPTIEVDAPMFGVFADEWADSRALQVRVQELERELADVKAAVALAEGVTA